MHRAFTDGKQEAEARKRSLDKALADALATQDVDLLWDARKRVQFVGAMEKLDGSILEILRRADPSFQRMPTQLASAFNDEGFMIDFLRRTAVDDDPHPYRNGLAGGVLGPSGLPVSGPVSIAD